MNASTATSRRSDRLSARGRSTALRIGLFGEFGCGNVGNDASLAAVLSMLGTSRPDARLTCVCRGPELITQAHGIDAVAMGWLGSHPDRLRWLPAKARKAVAKILDFPHTVSVLRKLDVVLVPGTGIAEQFGIPPWGIPLTLLRLGITSWMTRTKLAYISIGVEPATNPTSKFFLRHALGLASYRSYRDEFSLESARKLGVDVSKDRIYPDVAFALPVGFDVDKADLDEVGIGVIGYFGPGFGAQERQAANDSYVESMTTVVATLLASGHRIRLLTADNADVATARRVASAAAARLTPNGSAVALDYAPAADIDELLSQISTCSVVVASRFHNVIAAMLAQRAVVSLGYAPKHRALMTSVGLSEFCQELDVLDANLALAQIERALHDRTRIRDVLADSNSDYRLALSRQRQLLEGHVFGSAVA